MTARVGTEASGRRMEKSNYFQNWVTILVTHVITALRRQKLEDGKCEVYLSYTVEPLENQNPKRMTKEPEQQGTSHDPKLESQCWGTPDKSTSQGLQLCQLQWNITSCYLKEKPGSLLS